MRLKPLLLPTVAAVVVLLAGLALSSSRPAPGVRRGNVVVNSKRASVKVYMYAFTPSSLTVTVGTRITFTNHDMTAHTATALNGAFDTGTINPGQSRTIVVTKVGTFPYHCLFHAFMTGTITVRS